MTRRIGLTLGIGAAVLLLAVLVGMVGLLYVRPAVAQTSMGVPGMRQITVIGHGEVTGRPDTATVQIGVATDAPTAKDALAQNSAQAQAIQAKLKELGVDEKDIQTSNFTIYPTYSNEGRQVTGYHVSNNVTVKIRNLSQAGSLLDQVVQAGANSIYGVTFSVEDSKALLSQARQQAMQDAKARATQLATGGGAAVGDVLVITENIGAALPIAVPMAQAEAAQGAPTVPVQPGEQRFSVDVQATFGLQ
jgi:uncharacterized protein YggE